MMAIKSHTQGPLPGSRAVLLLALVVGARGGRELSGEELDAQFRAYLARWGKAYADAADYRDHRAAYARSAAFVAQHSRGFNVTLDSHFADLLPHELAMRFEESGRVLEESPRRVLTATP